MFVYRPHLINGSPFVDISALHQHQVPFFRLSMSYLPATLRRLTKDLLSNNWDYPNSAACLLEIEEKIYYRMLGQVGLTRFFPDAATNKYFTKPNHSLTFNALSNEFTLRKKNSSHHLKLRLDHAAFFMHDMVDLYLANFGIDDLLYTAALDCLSMLEESKCVQDLYSLARDSLKADMKMYRKLTDYKQKKKTSWFLPCKCMPPKGGSTCVIDCHGVCWTRFFSRDELATGEWQNVWDFEKNCRKGSQETEIKDACNDIETEEQQDDDNDSDDTQEEEGEEQELKDEESDFITFVDE